MSDTNTGGPAFPSEYFDPQLQRSRAVNGMALRDYFAAKAMQALLSQNLGGAVRDEILAGFSYAMADAMIKAKETK